jgi:Protein of unknown function (DUF2934)
MDHNLEKLIRERAYEIWTSHGCVHGQADQHWLAAEREIVTASTATRPGQPAPQKQRRLPARSKITKTLAGPVNAADAPRVTGHRWHRSLNEDAPFHRTKR